MARNYMRDFAEGYGFVDNIQRQRRLDAERAKDAGMRRELYGLQMDNTRDLMQQRDAGREVGRARTEAFRMGLGQPQGQPQGQDPRHETFAASLRDMGVEPNSPQGQQAFSKMKPLLDDPDRAGKALALAENIKMYLDKGQMPPGDEVTEYVNLVGESELQARSQDGLARKVKRFLPNQQGNGLFVEFDVTRPDGSHYAAPATVGKSADPSDNKVQNYSMEEVLEWFGGSYAALMMVLDAEAKAGVNTTAAAYQQHRQGIQAEAAKRAQTLEDEERGDRRTLDRYRGQKEIDQEFEAPKGPDHEQVKLADGRVKLIDKNTGRVIATYGSASEVPGGAGARSGSGGGASASDVRQAYAEVRQIIKESKTPDKLTQREVSQIQAVLNSVGHEAATEDVTKGLLWWKKVNNEITGFGPMGDEGAREEGDTPGGQEQASGPASGPAWAQFDDGDTQAQERMAQPFYEVPPAPAPPPAVRGSVGGLGASEAQASTTAAKPARQGLVAGLGDYAREHGAPAQIQAAKKLIERGNEAILFPIVEHIIQTRQDYAKSAGLMEVLRTRDLPRIKAILNKYPELVVEATTGLAERAAGK